MLKRLEGLDKSVGGIRACRYGRWEIGLKTIPIIKRIIMGINFAAGTGRVEDALIWP